MSEKHTPGPWKVASAAACLEIEVMEIAEVSHLRVIPAAGGWPTPGTPEADARLIAAAPDLLEALRRVHLWMDDQADGQSKGGHATFDLLMLREQRDIAAAAIAKVEGGAA